MAKLPRSLTFALALLALGSLAPARGQGSDPGAPIAELKRLRDATPAETFEALGALGSREALDALLETYGHLGSLAARERALLALGRFGGNSQLEHRALDQVLAVAGDERSPYLQRAAVRVLASAGGAGRDFLAMVVDAPLADELRVLAMELHTQAPRDQDFGWYRELWKPSPKPPPDPAPRGREKAPIESAPKPRAHDLAAIRALGFAALAPRLTPAELLEAIGDGSGSVRLSAVRELEARGAPEAKAAAERLFPDPANPAPVRAAAARILAASGGDEVLEQVVQAGVVRGAPEDLVRALGTVVSKAASAEFAKDLARRLGRAKDHERAMLARSLAGHVDERVAAQLRKWLGERDRDLALLAAELLAQSGDPAVAEELERQFQRAKEPADRAALFERLVAVRAAERGESWLASLRRWSAEGDSQVAALALGALFEVEGRAALPELEAALSHEDWSVRLQAARLLERLRVRESVALLVARLPQESGRLRLELGELLGRLTGEGHGVHADRWQRWWESGGRDLEPISLAKLGDLQKEAELRRLESATAVEVFGLRLESDRITFVVDVSGSMEWPTRGRYVGEPGEKRILVAKRELRRAVEGLAPNTLFNIITFSERARPWQKQLVRASADQVKAAAAHVDKFLPGGATNLYEALELAFSDPGLDTLLVLSDGQPFGGKVDDPVRIRDHVRAWNAGRGVRIHTVAIAEMLPVLRWLSEDTGGTHVFVP